MRLLRVLLLLPLLVSAQVGFNVASRAPYIYSSYFPSVTPYAIGDFNLDGKPDFVGMVGGMGLRISISAANGLFVTNSFTVPSTVPWDLVPGDFNSDGKTDLAVIGSTRWPTGDSYFNPDPAFPDGSLQILLGNGSGGFSLGSKLPITPNHFRRAVAADFDRDGNLDLVLMPATSAHLLRGDGRGGFSSSAEPVFSSPITLYPQAQLHLGDFNSDGRPDIVVRQFNPDPFFIALGDGQGRFSMQSAGQWLATHTIPAGPTASCYPVPQVFTSCGDLDMDGSLDLIQISSDYRRFEISYGNGQSGSVTLGAFTGLPIEAVDFDGDRRLDLLLGVPDAPGNGAAQLMLNASNFTPRILSQSIAFQSLGDRSLSSGTLALTPTASSGLPVTIASRSSNCSVFKNVVTLNSVGGCSLVAIQSGNSAYAPAVQSMTFNITNSEGATQPQTITFAALTDRPLSSSPLTLSATSSSGLPVTLTSTTPSTCTLSGSTATLLAAGTCSITASQPGNSTYAAAPSVTRSFTITAPQTAPPRIDAITNAASNVPGTVAPASYAALYGINLAPSPTLILRDAQGTQAGLTITYSSATQINFLLPDSVSPGPANLTITNANGSATFSTNIARTVPGLFSADGSGRGPAAAHVLIVNPDKTITTRLVADGSIPVLAGMELYLVLYGTGIRGSSNVIARVAGRPVDVLYAGAQGAYPGLDQVNLRIPLSVGGMGTIEVQVTVDGASSNAVTIAVN